MLLNFPIFQYGLVGFCAAYILFSNIYSAFCKENVAIVLIYIAIPMHLLLLFGLGILGAELDVVLAVLLALVLPFVLVRYVRYRKSRRDDGAHGVTSTNREGNTV